MSDDDNEEGIAVLIDFEHSITMVRLVENIFLPSQIHIKAAVMPLAETTENDYTIAFAKVRYWLENVMSRCIAFNRNNQAAVKIWL